MSARLPLIFVAVFAFAANSICTRYFQLRVATRSYSIRLYQSLFCMTASVCFTLSNRCFEIPNASAVAFGILFGIFFFSAVFCSAQCYICGPMSLTAIITNLSMVIPLLYSCLIRRESISPIQMAGLVLMIITAVLSGKSGNSEKNATSWKWFVYVSISFLSNGLTAVIQKHYRATYSSTQSTLFMAAAYFTAGTLFCILYITGRKKDKERDTPVVSSRKQLAALTLVSGCGSFAGNGLLMNLSTKVNASILYPCLNGGLCIIVAITSFLAFKEKLTIYKTMAICVGLTAIIVLNI